MSLWVYALILLVLVLALTGWVDWRRRHSTGGDPDHRRESGSDSGYIGGSGGAV